MRRFRSCLAVMALVLPALWLSSGCGGGAEPPEEAGPAKAPEVEQGQPAKTPTEAKPDEAGAKQGAKAAPAEGWGDVTGRIVYDGDPPEPEVLVQEGAADIKDAQVCAQHQIVGQQLVVHEENKGLANVFVYLRRADRVAPELAQAPTEPAVLDQKGCVFIPHALIARKDQGLVVKSDDPIKHNTRINFLRNQGFNQILAANERDGLEVPLTTGELHPAPVKCDIHQWMSAWILVLDHPYGTVTDENGQFTLQKLPAGELELMIRHEKAGFIDRAYKVTVQADGTTDIGEIKVSPSQFEQ